VERYKLVAEAFLAGLEDRAQAGLPLARIDSVASFFLSRIDVLIDPQLEKIAAESSERGALAQSMVGEVALASAKQAYQIYKELFAGPRWAALQAQGAETQRLLWASTGSKDPAAPDTLYVEALAAAETINTMPEKTLKAFADHGSVHAALPTDGGYAEVVLEEFHREGVDVVALAKKLQDEGAESFKKSWDALLTRIAEKSVQLAAKAHV
jgi:transaldolase/glucose-6-phosphate isomerase